MRGIVLALTGLSLACGLPGTRSTVQLEWQAAISTILTLDMLAVTITDGSDSWDIEGSDFSDEYGGAPRTVEYRTRSSGKLQLEFSLSDSTDFSIAAGKVSIPLQLNWRLGVDFHFAPRNPYNHCFGCTGYQEFPLAEAYWEVLDDTTVIDSLYIVWGGSPLGIQIEY